MVECSGREVVLARRPDGSAAPTDFSIRDYQLHDCASGEVTISTRLISIDPYVRCLLDAESPYGGTLAIGDRIVGDAVSVVTRSRDARFPVGSTVVGRTGWATVSNVQGDALRRLEPWIQDYPLALSALGGTGLTAFIGVTEIARPRIGETALVSGASGGVGVIAIQLLRAAGCQVIAIAGGPAKAGYIRSELGFDKVVDYKATTSITALVQDLAPGGINIYFDNVGGILSGQIYQNLAVGGRVVLCGEVSQYNSPGHEFNPRLLGPLMAQRASISAFLVSDYKPNFDDYRRRLHTLIVEQKLKDVHDIVVGLENAPGALIGMLQGDNKGKRIVRVDAA